MRPSPALLAIAAVLAAGPALALDDHPSPGACLSPGDAQEVVGARQVVAPGRAIVQAREAVPNAEILRASLCRETDALVYHITALRKDGRIVRVTVDAPSGKVKAVH